MINKEAAAEFANKNCTKSVTTEDVPDTMGE
jgi:hypothetical protein